MVNITIREAALARLVRQWLELEQSARNRKDYYVEKRALMREAGRLLGG